MYCRRCEEDMLCIAMPLMDGTGFGLYMAGLYEVERQDNKSGTVSFTQYDWEWDEYLDECEFQYSDLTATSVRLVCEMVFGVSDPIAFTRMDEPYEIVVDGEDDPVGTIENGDYWFLNGTKVMAPLPEGEWNLITNAMLTGLRGTQWWITIRSCLSLALPWMRTDIQVLSPYMSSLQ